MKVTYFKPSGAIVLEVTPKEFDIISHAMLLLSWTAIDTEKDTEKLKMIEDIKDALTQVVNAYRI